MGFGFKGFMAGATSEQTTLEGFGAGLFVLGILFLIGYCTGKADDEDEQKKETQSIR